MTKRPLTKEETDLTMKNLNKHKTTLSVLETAMKITKFKIEEELPFNHSQELQRENIKLKNINNKIDDTTGLIKVTENQLTNGIEDFEQPTEEK